MELRGISLVAFRLILKGILKEYFRLISSLMKSIVILESLQKDINWGWDSSCSLYLGHKIFSTLPIICSAGFKGREKWIIVYQTE